MATWITACRSARTMNWATWRVLQRDDGTAGRRAGGDTTGRSSKSACDERRRSWSASTRPCWQSEKMASIGKLAATVAHEINNPLFGILTYARLPCGNAESSDIRRTRTRWRSSSRPSSGRASAAANMMQEPAHLLAPGAQPSRAERSEHARRSAPSLLVKHKLDLQSIELMEDLAAGSAAGGMRRQPDPAGHPGAAGERGGSHAQGRHARGRDGPRRRRRAVRGAREGYRVAASRRTFCRRFSTRFSRPRKTRTAPGSAWRWRRASSSSTREKSRSAPTPGEGTEFMVALPAAAACSMCSTERETLDGDQRRIVWQQRSSQQRRSEGQDSDRRR